MTGAFISVRTFYFLKDRSYGFAGLGSGFGIMVGVKVHSGWGILSTIVLVCWKIFIFSLMTFEWSNNLSKTFFEAYLKFLLLLVVSAGVVTHLFVILLPVTSKIFGQEWSCHGSES